MNKIFFLSFSVLWLSSCGNIRSDELFDLSPDYRQSSVGPRLEVPPQLVALEEQGLKVPDEERYSYQKAQQEALQQPQAFLDVLPQLEGVQQEENRIVIESDVNAVWLWTKRYFEREGIPLQQSDTLDGVMQTQWLVDNNQMPQTGVAKLLGKLGILERGERDRYRLQFSRQGKKTQIEIQHRRLSETAIEKGSKNDVPDYQWQESKEGQPKLEQEMARRLALYLSQQRRLSP